MKKIISFLFIYVLLTINQANAEIIPNKVYGISTQSFEKIDFKRNKILTFSAIDDYKIIDDIYVTKGADFSVKIDKYVEPKRGKKDGYLKIKVLSYETAEKSNEFIDLSKRNITGSLKHSTPKDLKEIMESAGISVVGKLLKVPGFSQAYAATKGLIKPNEGESRLKSAGHNLYESTPLTYVEEGEDLIIEEDSIIVIKVKERKKKK